MAFRCDVTRLAFVLLSCLVHVGIGSRRPNIVLIMADDLGWNDVSFHGSNQIPTPNIDALAYNGIILNSHYVPALCTPSRASLLTGKYPTSMGMQHLVILAPEPWGLPLEETLMPEHLKRHGYATHAVGKWHLGFHQKAYTPTHRGFDTHFGYWNGYQDYYDHTMEDHTLEGAPQPLKGYDMRRGLDVDYASRGEYSTDAFTNEAVQIIRNHNATQGPLFLYLAHLSPHSGNPDKPFQAPDDEIAKHSHITDPERRVYAAMVTRLDEGVGRVVSALREANLLENSIVLFFSDNGAVTFGVHSNRGSNYPLRGLKESPWEGGVRGVAALWSPLLNRTRRVSNQLMHVSDWLPTLYSAAGLNTSELGQIDGIDMWDTLSQDRESPRTEVFNNFDEVEGYSSLRVGAWKYIEGTAQGGDVDLWYGETGEEAAYIGYDVDRVLHSKAGVAIIGHLTDRQLEDEDIPSLMTRDEMLQLRRDSIVTCDSTPFGANLTGDVSELRSRLIRDLDEIRYKYPFADVKTYEMDRRAVEELKDGRDADDLFSCDPLKMVCVFNLEADPCERVNLAKVYPQLVAYLQSRLKDLKETVVKPRNVPGDPFCDPVLHNGTWSNWRDYVASAGYDHSADAFIDSVTSALRTPMREFLVLLADNVLLKIVYSPILFLVNESLHLFIHDGKTLTPVAAFVLLSALCLAVYSLVKRYASDPQDDDKGFSVTLSTPRKVSGRFVKR